MDFIALDFETANEKRSSPCSIGIVVVKNGKVVEKIHHLIKPKEMRFMPINIGIHGIRPAMVENELEFDGVWQKVKKYFENSLVIAHNASFDISVLRKSAELYGIELPEFNYICTMKLARNFYKSIDNAKLNTVNDLLGYKFKHHDALYDALACGNILTNICDELNCYDIEEISNLLGVTIGKVNKDGYVPSSTKGRVYRTSSKIYSYKKQRVVDRFAEDAFMNEVVVITGKLASMSREEAYKAVRLLGGTAGSSVTRKTTILVSNVSGISDLSRAEMSTKMKKAVDLSERGQKIKFLNEEEFLNYNKFEKR